MVAGAHLRSPERRGSSSGRCGPIQRDSISYRVRGGGKGQRPLRMLLAASRKRPTKKKQFKPRVQTLGQQGPHCNPCPPEDNRCPLTPWMAIGPSDQSRATVSVHGPRPSIQVLLVCNHLIGHAAHPGIVSSGAAVAVGGSSAQGIHNHMASASLWPRS